MGREAFGRRMWGLQEARTETSSPMETAVLKGLQTCKAGSHDLSLARSLCVSRQYTHMKMYTHTHTHTHTYSLCPSSQKHTHILSDRGYMDSNNCLSRTEIALSVSCKHLSRIVVGPHIVGLTPLDNSIRSS